MILHMYAKYALHSVFAFRKEAKRGRCQNICDPSHWTVERQAGLSCGTFVPLQGFYVWPSKSQCICGCWSVPASRCSTAEKQSLQKDPVPLLCPARHHVGSRVSYLHERLSCGRPADTARQSQYISLIFRNPRIFCKFELNPVCLPYLL